MPTTKYEFVVNGEVVYTCFDEISVSAYAFLLDGYGRKYEIVETSLIRTRELQQHKADIKTELLQICEAFGLGSLEMFTMQPSSKEDGYIFTQFQTTIGRYNHFYKIKNKIEL